MISEYFILGSPPPPNRWLIHSLICTGCIRKKNASINCVADYILFLNLSSFFVSLMVYKMLSLFWPIKTQKLPGFWLEPQEKKIFYLLPSHLLLFISDGLNRFVKKSARKESFPDVSVDYCKCRTIQKLVLLLGKEKNSFFFVFP